MEEKDKTPMETEVPAEGVKNEEAPKRSAFLRFLDRKDIKLSAKRYGIDAMSAMALGLFGSLLIATIFNAIGLIPGLGFFATIGA